MFCPGRFSKRLLPCFWQSKPLTRAGKAASAGLLCPKPPASRIREDHKGVRNPVLLAALLPGETRSVLPLGGTDAGFFTKTRSGCFAFGKVTLVAAGAARAAPAGEARGPVYHAKRRGDRKCGSCAYCQYRIGGKRMPACLGCKGAYGPIRPVAARRMRLDAPREVDEGGSGRPGTQWLPDSNPGAHAGQRGPGSETDA